MEENTEKDEDVKQLVNFKVENWAIASSHWVGIEIFKIKKINSETKEESYTYNPVLLVSLNYFDGKSTDEMPPIELQKVIGVSMDRYFTEARVAAIFAFQYVKEMFLHLSTTINVFDEHKELVEEIDLNSFIEQ